jgi:hypothetical protein
MLFLESWKYYDDLATAMARSWEFPGLLGTSGVTLLNPGVRVTNGSIFVTNITRQFEYGLERIHLGFYFTPRVVTNDSGGSNGSFLHLNADGTGNTSNQVGFSVDNNRRLLCFTGDNISGLGGTTVANGSTVLTLFQQYHIEIDVYFNPTGGTMELRLDGVLEMSFSGNTDPRNKRYINSLTFIAGQGGSANCSYDFHALYVDDMLDWTESFWFGDHTIEYLIPNADDTPLDFIPSSGTNNYEIVAAPNSAVATRYVESDTVPASDFYAHTALPITPAYIPAVQVRTTAVASGSAALRRKAIRPRVRVDGVLDNNWQGRMISTSQENWRSIFPLQPNGNLWTKTAVDDSHIGFGTVPYVRGWNFRSSALVPGSTEPAHTTHVRGTDIYPVTRDGTTFGWETTAPGTILDRTSADPRTAGVHAQANNGTQRTWRVDLPETGRYFVRVFVGDAQFAHSPIYFRVLDGSNVLRTVDYPFGTGIDEWANAGFNIGARSHRNGSNPEYQVSEAFGEWYDFATTQLKVLIGYPTASGSLFTCLSHVEVMGEFIATVSGAPNLRVSQLAMEVMTAENAPPTANARITQMVVLTMAPNIVACPTPDEGENLCLSVDDPILFSSWDPGDGVRRWYAETSLDDADDYYGGWKENRLLSVSEVRRALAGPNHDYEVGNFSVEFADEDYVVRTAMGRYFNAREVEVFAVTPDGRDEQVTAKTIATGFVDADPSFDDAGEAMSVRLTCRDRIGQAIGWTQTGQSKLPRRTLTTVNLPGCDPSALGLATPWWYGTLSSNITASGVFTPPIHDVDGTHCGAFDGAFPGAGFGNWFNPPAPMGTVTLDVQVGGSLPQETPHNEGRYYVQVFPVAANGDVGDPYPFCSGSLFADINVGAGEQQIEASWAPVSGASRYIAVLGVFYYGVRPSQYIETTGTSVVFTDNPGWMEEGSIWDMITPGARPPEDAQITYYHVRSKNGPIVSELSPSMSFSSVSVRTGFNCSNGGKFRPARIWWQSTGAPEYEVLSKGPGGPITGTEYEWKWIVPSGQFDIAAGLHYFDNDFLYLDAIPLGAEEARAAGRIKPFYTRDVVLQDTDTWREFLVAGCAIQNVDDWYYDPMTGPASSVEINQGDGTEWLWPKDGSQWFSQFTTKYRDITGLDGRTRRFTLGYGRGTKADLVASGQSRITLNIKGIEQSGASTGDLITDLHDQCLHFLRNMVVASGEGYMTGAWANTPTMGFDSICVINEESFAELKAMRESEITGGLVTAGGIGANGEQIDVTEGLRQFMVSGDFRLGPNRFWQIAAFAIDENLSQDDLSDPLTDEFDIHVRTMKPMPRLAELQNLLPYKYKRNYVEDRWDVDNQLYTNQDSIDRWRVSQLADATEFHFITDATLAQFMIQKQARRRGDAPTYITLEGSVCLMNAAYDVGRYFPITHWRGIQVPSGYRDRPLWITASTFNPASRRVRLDCMDVSYLVPSGVGGFN